MHARAQAARVIMPQQRPLKQNLLVPPHQLPHLPPQRRVLEKLHIRRLVVGVDELLDFGVAVGEAAGADAEVVRGRRRRVEDAFFRGGARVQHTGREVGLEVAGWWGG